ncbi:16S rRNA m(4)C1402 methyltransferase [Nitrospira tepida]|uniref:Ribosomal RNA small subunit methyltransferase H n=1 Tax=Nitrospira tepida TaxID=2973512 RepID=A0AA86MXA9_9BACT|nr:16S rRNA (cytosine(1402)-N(4))-methyltransferase RsmH [Nitrospira tepida]CAI4030594.1 16S rRNA m(4)C1402 methyltransferase [Nitrospira tepida]
MGVYFATEWEKVVGNGELVNAEESHAPVLADEVITWLQPRSGGRYLDCTVGYGGLAERLLSRTPGDSMVIGIDQDALALEASRNRLRPFGNRVQLIQGNFRDVKQHLAQVGILNVDGAVLDLGVSTPQLSRPERGFSFSENGPLDMRMDQTGSLTAADIVNRWSESDLAWVMFHYGEERYARRIARALVAARKEAPLRTTFDLVEVIRRAIPVRARHGRIHFATRTFQAIRIAVNRELEVLEAALPQLIDVLTVGGRLCVISFHSLEDRIVKQAFRAREAGPSPDVKILTKKPQVATAQELERNPRARSAKLRVLERAA